MRHKILALQTMEDMHTFLVNFNPFSTSLSIDQLVIAAVSLMRDHPPDRMRRHARIRFVHSCAVEAMLVDNCWWVPETPTPRLDLASVASSVAASLALGRVFVGPAALVCVAVAVGAAFWQGG